LSSGSPEQESDDAEERGKSVGWLGHQDGLKPQLTVAEQLDFFASLYRANADRALLARWVWRARRICPAAISSAGQRRRLALRGFGGQTPAMAVGRAVRGAGRKRTGVVEHLMARHCGDGGIIIAATHEPLGLGNESLKL